MTEEEKSSTLAQPEFLDFIEHSTKIIQRALNDNYDYVRDYTIGTETGPCVFTKRSSARVLTAASAVTTRKGVASNAYASSMMSGRAKIDPSRASTGRRK